MSKLLKLDMHSRRMCFKVETEKCCGKQIFDLERFHVAIKKDSVHETAPVLEYDFFDLDQQGRMCIYFDDAMGELCPARYVFQIYLDECVLVDTIKFSWGAKPAITEACVESNSASAAFDETGATCSTDSPLVNNCCDVCPAEDPCACDPCSSCNCKPCGCGPELSDPTQLLARDC